MKGPGKTQQDFWTEGPLVGPGHEFRCETNLCLCVFLQLHLAACVQVRSKQKSEFNVDWSIARSDCKSWNEFYCYQQATFCQL